MSKFDQEITTILGRSMSVATREWKTLPELRKELDERKTIYNTALKNNMTFRLWRMGLLAMLDRRSQEGGKGELEYALTQQGRLILGYHQMMEAMAKKQEQKHAAPAT